MTDLQRLRFDLDAVKANPPGDGDTVYCVMRKITAAFDLSIRISEAHLALCDDAAARANARPVSLDGIVIRP